MSIHDVFQKLLTVVYGSRSVPLRPLSANWLFEFRPSSSPCILGSERMPGLLLQVDLMNISITQVNLTLNPFQKPSGHL